MFELARFYRTLFYLAAALLGVQVAYALSFIHSPLAGWALYCAFMALAASIPMLIGACLAALFGYLKVLQTLLIFGGLAAALWFTLTLMSYSILAGILFASVGLICFKMLHYQYQDSKKDESSS
jgi:hypothetical protein